MSTMRLRVRPIRAASDLERERVWSSRLCLSVPHIGEAIDYASGYSKLRGAEEGTERPRILHYGHELGSACGGERCLFLDYVPADQAKDQDELDVASLVAKAR